jgi:hypothetical protein
MTRIQLLEVGQAIRAKRYASGLRLWDVAVLTGLHVNTVVLAERGASSRESLQRICSALSITLEPEGAL